MCKNNGKVNIALFAAAVLLCLTLFTTHLTSGLYARYTTEASGSDSARVAKWDVQLNNTGKTMEFIGSNYEGSVEVMEYVFTVTSHSEVAMHYSINVTLGTALPEQVKLRLDKTGEWLHCGEGKTEFSFDTEYSYGVGDSPKSHTLEIQVEYAVGDTPHIFSELQNIPVTITVKADQED